MSKVRIVRPEPAHRGEWERLYAAYAAFYEVEQTAEMRARVWSWLHDPGHMVEALIALDAAGKPIGLAHFRSFARPLAERITRCCRSSEKSSRSIFKISEADVMVPNRRLRAQR